MLLLLALVASGATQEPAAATQDPPVFRAGTNLVVQTVRVTDGDGTPIEGLTARDFIVTEDGELQDIAFVEYQRLRGSASIGAELVRARRDAGATDVSPPTQSGTT